MHGLLQEPPEEHLSLSILSFSGVRGGVEKFRASSSCSNILKNKKYFNTVKNFRANSVFRASAGCSKF